MLVIMVILITLMIIPLTFDNAGRGELAFRTMWSEFEWENKININIIGTVPMVAGKKPTVPPLQPQPQRGSQATQLELQ